jgi:hypothetical protein
MKRIAVFTMLALGLASAIIAHAEVTGRTYQVTVKSNFGTTFTDCFRFDAPSAGQLTIDGLGPAITYRHGQLDFVNTRFKAVSRSGQPLSIMFYGEEVEGLEQLNAEAVNEFGDTFVFTGSETPNCVRALDAVTSAVPWSSQ